MSIGDLYTLPGDRGTISLSEVETIEPRGEYPDECTLVMRSGRRISVGAGANGSSAKSLAFWTNVIASAKVPAQAMLSPSTQATGTQLEKAQHSATFLVEDLQRALKTADPLEAMMIHVLIEHAAETRQQLEAFALARIART